MNVQPYTKYLNDPDVSPETLELFKKLVMESTVYAAHGESATQYFLFDNDTSDQEIEDILVGMGYGVHETFCKHSYDCCGNWYRTEVNIYPMVEGQPRLACRGKYQNV